MIVDMLKYTFLLHHLEQEKFLEKIGQLGVIDITINNYDPSQEESNMIAHISKLKTTIDALKNGSMASKTPSKVNDIKDVDKFIECVETTKERLENLNSDISKVVKELTSTEPWGEYSKDTFDKMRSEGLSFRFFVCGDKQYMQEWEEEYNVFLVERLRGNAYFVLVSREGDELVSIPNFGTEVREPIAKHSEIVAKVKALEEEKANLCDLLGSLKADIDFVNDAFEKENNELHYIRIKSGNETAAEGTLIIVESWCPKDKCEAVDNFLETTNDVIFFKDIPTIEENPPVLLKNNWFAETNELITKLYSLPNYHEADVTGFYAPFFIFFVGLCLCDIGYGMLFLILALIAKFKNKVADKRPVINLVMLCSLSTIMMGCITGIFFGASLADMNMFEPIKDLFVEQNSLFGFSLTIGVIQIIYATILRAVFNMKRRGFKYGLTHLGWAGAIITGCMAYLEIGGLTTDSMTFKVAIGVSLAIMMLFSNPDKGILSNIGLGIYGLYNNITSLLGDVLSYIRLFALGLSGGVIAGIFNQLAVGMSGDIPIVKYLIMALILLVGHGINLFMGAIGAFVHPLRLTFVEFYKNVGFEGGGRAYNPLSRNKK